ALSSHCCLMKDLRAEATQLLAKPEVPWSRLRAITLDFRQSAGSTDGLLLHEVCHGSKLVMKPPQRREKSKELQDRLTKLQEQVDQASYNKMVSDVTKQERAAAALRSGALQTYKQQISFGLHVIVMMGTFYAVGHIAGTALSPRTAVRAACGMCGLVFAMLVETVLLMIETSRFEGPKDRRQQETPLPSSDRSMSHSKKAQ
ncbi:MAG: hypothetical protein FRX49_04910, partial [Trebouxia sp. A1-2]